MAPPKRTTEGGGNTQEEEEDDEMGHALLAGHQQHVTQESVRPAEELSVATQRPKPCQDLAAPLRLCVLTTHQMTHAIFCLTCTSWQNTPRSRASALPHTICILEFHHQSQEDLATATDSKSSIPDMSPLLRGLSDGRSLTSMIVLRHLSVLTLLASTRSCSAALRPPFPCKSLYTHFSQLFCLVFLSGLDREDVLFSRLRPIPSSVPLSGKSPCSPEVSQYHSTPVRFSQMSSSSSMPNILYFL